MSQETVDIPLSIDAWLTQTTEFNPAAEGSAPHIGRPMTGWTVGMEPLASPILSSALYTQERIKEAILMRSEGGRCDKEIETDLCPSNHTALNHHLGPGAKRLRFPEDEICEAADGDLAD